jgi:hypothetical protein
MRQIEKELRAALLEMFIDAEQMAVNGYTTYIGPGSVFNDKIWKQEDPDGFAMARRARKLLGLKPFRHRGKNSPSYSVRDSAGNIRKSKA